MRRSLRGLLTLCWLAGFARGAAPEAARFPFVIGGDSETGSAADMSWLNARPAGADGFVTIRDGRFATSAGRLRIWGVNLCFNANFPERTDAEKVAARLAGLGINGVRMHHHDTAEAPRGIWAPGRGAPRALSAEMLDRQDYLLDQLHRRGIYANLNLHVGRALTEAEGFASRDLPRDFRYDKFLLYFVPGMRDRLKEFCRAYLLHENPYRKLRRVDDPGIAMIEITNENSFHTLGARVAHRLPEPYRAEFVRQWNTWLRKKYETSSALRKAWAPEPGEPPGEVLVEALPQPGDRTWRLHRAGASFEPVFHQPGPGGVTNAVKMDIRKPAAALHEQELIRDGLTLREGGWYTLTFSVRADAPRPLHVDVSRSGPDHWSSIGLSEVLNVTPEWREIRRVFKASGSEPGRARLCFKFGGDATAFQVAGLRLQRGGTPEPLPPGQTVEAGNVDIPAERSPAEVLADLRAFMIDVETGFIREMVDHLKKDLGVRVPITASQITYHNPAIVAGTCDYADVHAYWEHPRFPNRPWDPKDWTIGNTPMERRPGEDALSVRAPWRLLDRPYTLSEWNIPEPNDYAGSVVPFAAMIASLQDWDGVFFFTYSNGGASWDSDKVEGFFSFNGQPVKLALLAAVAPVFRRGDLSPLARTAAGTLESMLPARMVLASRIGIDPAARAPAPTNEAPSGARLATPDGRVRWDAAAGERAHVVVNDRAVRAVWGLVGGRGFDLGGLHVDIGAAERDYAVLWLSSLDGKPVEESKRLLLVAAGSAGNAGMEWNETRTSVANRWGRGPAQANGIPAAFALRTPLRRVFALDSRGHRTAEVPVEVRDGRLRGAVGPECRTLWYEIAAP